MPLASLRARLDGGGSPDGGPWGVDSEHGVLRDVLIGPSDYYRWLSTSSISRRTLRLGFEFDATVAHGQWSELVAALEAAAVRCHFLAPDAALPYQVFARDSSVMTPWGALVTQMNQPWRRGEHAACTRFYFDNGIPIWDTVTAGSVEGGDLMVLEPGLVLCGQAERTSAAGFAQLAGWFEAEGWTVKRYTFDPFFVHMDCQLAVLAEKLAVACVDTLEPEFVDWLKGLGYTLIEVPYRDAVSLGTNVLALGGDRVIVPRESKRLVEQCKALGLRVYDPELSMISRGGGAVHCMTQPLRRDRVRVR